MKNFKFDFRKMLILFAIVPLVLTASVLSLVMLPMSSNEIQNIIHNEMITSATEIGTNFDYVTECNESSMLTFMSAPIIKEYLKNPTDSALASKAQQYTQDYYSKLDGWEGIYLADWNSKVLTHPVNEVVGRVMREGDALTSLQTAMLDAENGVYNVGIINSPASGQLIMSMYAPIFDDDGVTPLGYVGGGTFVNKIASKISDVSSMKLPTAYTYYVDATGTMLYHPDELKIGKPVENDAVKSLLKDLDAGKKLTTDVITYKYKGVEKYASYYIGKDSAYILIIAADKSDIMSIVNTLVYVTIFAVILLLVILSAIVIWLAKVITKPLNGVANALTETAQGSLDANVDLESNVYETKLLIASVKVLKDKLNEIIGQIQSISTDLNAGAESVNSLAQSSSAGSAQITSSMHELSDAAMSLAENVQNINSEIGDMGVAIDNISESAVSLVECSNNIKTANEEAINYITKVADSSVKSVDAVQNINTQIGNTNEAVARIKSAVEMISSIASQTNLLALNASIEAARAGESGRGFAVVAGEIKHLSEQSNNSAEEIKKVVQEIVENSESSVKLASEVASIIADEQKFINETQTKFTVLNNEINTSLQQIDGIGVKVEALNKSKNSITGAVSDLSAISEENAASNQEITASVNEIANSIEEIAMSSDNTEQLAERLLQTVSYFK